MENLAELNNRYRDQLLKLLDVIGGLTHNDKLFWQISFNSSSPVVFSSEFMNLKIKVEKVGEHAQMTLGSTVFPSRVPGLYNSILLDSYLDSLYDRLGLNFRDAIRVKRQEAIIAEIGVIESSLKTLEHYDTEGIPL